MIDRLRELGARLLVGSDQASVDLWLEIQEAAVSRDPVLITGETGTGKELIARELHRLSPRGDLKLVVCNCADFAAATATSELFGHVRGAFTGADRAAPGLFKIAHGSTLFLDELGELPLDVQAKLLRAIELGEIRPSGGSSVDNVDVRVIAATNLPVDAAVTQGKFRRDLKARFPVRIHARPLRERRDDIPILVDHIIHRHRGDPGHNSKARTLAPAALERLCRHLWPENVRALRAAVCTALRRTAKAGVDVLELGAFDELPSDGSPLQALVNDVAEGQCRLADGIIEEILAGRHAPGSPPDLSKQYPQASLRFQLACQFKKRFPGVATRENLERVFGVTTVEAINKIVREETSTTKEQSANLR